MTQVSCDKKQVKTKKKATKKENIVKINIVIIFFMY